jgi:hypothetical protein
MNMTVQSGRFLTAAQVFKKTSGKFKADCGGPAPFRQSPFSYGDLG